MTESLTQKQIQLELSKGPTRLFRNNTAQAWSGSRVVRNPDNSITIFDPRPIRSGLCVGSSDLIGWTTVNNSAIFTAIEVKSQRGRATNEQLNFIDQVKRAGGLAGIAKSVQEARQILNDKLRRD